MKCSKKKYKTHVTQTLYAARRDREYFIKASFTIKRIDTITTRLLLSNQLGAERGPHRGTIKSFERNLFRQEKQTNEHIQHAFVHAHLVTIKEIFDASRIK